MIVTKLMQITVVANADEDDDDNDNTDEVKNDIYLSIYR